MCNFLINVVLPVNELYGLLPFSDNGVDDFIDIE